MSVRSADVVIIGAGIAGAATMYELAAKRQMADVVVVDPRPPMTLTSANSTECYRNFFPARPLVELAERSIDLLEEMAEISGDAFNMSRQGYLFVTGDGDRLESLIEAAQVASSFVAGPVRQDLSSDNSRRETRGFDIYRKPADLLERFPYLTDRAIGAIHLRRAGWLSAHQLGTWMLARAKEKGGRIINDEVVGVDFTRDTVRGVFLRSGEFISAGVVVNAAGPMSRTVCRLVGIDLPVRGEVHHQASFRDHLGAFPRDAPMMIWADPQAIDWSREETQALAEQGHDELIGEIGVSPYGRPEGRADSQYFFGLWDYHSDVWEHPTLPVPAASAIFAEAVLRGLETMIPALSRYRDRLPHAVIDGGYIMKTPENLPLIGPAGPEGFHLLVAMSGYGVMISPAAAELVADHIVGVEAQGVSSAFLATRYSDPSYLQRLDLNSTGELSKAASQRRSMKTDPA